jgi:hypothetical protein
LKFPSSKGFKKILLHLDAKVVVENIRDFDGVSPDGKILVQQIHRLMQLDCVK